MGLEQRRAEQRAPVLQQASKQASRRGEERGTAVSRRSGKHFEMCTCIPVRTCPRSLYSFSIDSQHRTQHITSAHVSVGFLALTVQLQTLNPSRQDRTRGPSVTARESFAGSTSASELSRLLIFRLSATRRDETGIFGARDPMARTPS